MCFRPKNSIAITITVTVFVSDPAGLRENRRPRAGLSRSDRPRSDLSRPSRPPRSVGLSRGGIRSRLRGAPRRSSRIARRLSLIRLPSSARQRTSTWSPSLSSSLTSRTCCSEISLMCSRPSVPGKISIKAPKAATLVTLPRYSLPTSGEAVKASMRLDRLLGLCPVSRSDADVAFVIHVDLGAGLLLDSLDVLAARPDQIPDLGHRNLDLRDLRGRARRSPIAARKIACVPLSTGSRDGLPALGRAPCPRTSRLTLGCLMSICRAVMPASVPATLKSMSP